MRLSIPLCRQELQHKVTFTWGSTLYVPLTTVTSSSFLTETAPTCTIIRNTVSFTTAWKYHHAEV